jgi:hypothetical protein
MFFFTSCSGPRNYTKNKIVQPQYVNLSRLGNILKNEKISSWGYAVFRHIDNYNIKEKEKGWVYYEDERSQSYVLQMYRFSINVTEIGAVIARDKITGKYYGYFRYYSGLTKNNYIFDRRLPIKVMIDPKRNILYLASMGNYAGWNNKKYASEFKYDFEVFGYITKPNPKKRIW